MVRYRQHKKDGFLVAKSGEILWVTFNSRFAKGESWPYAVDSRGFTGFLPVHYVRLVTNNVEGWKSNACFHSYQNQYFRNGQYLDKAQLILMMSQHRLKKSSLKFLLRWDNLRILTLLHSKKQHRFILVRLIRSLTVLKLSNLKVERWHLDSLAIGSIHEFLKSESKLKKLGLYPNHNYDVDLFRKSPLRWCFPSMGTLYIYNLDQASQYLYLDKLIKYPNTNRMYCPVNHSPYTLLLASNGEINVNVS